MAFGTIAAVAYSAFEDSLATAKSNTRVTSYSYVHRELLHKRNLGFESRRIHYRPAGRCSTWELTLLARAHRQFGQCRRFPGERFQRSCGSRQSNSRFKGGTIVARCFPIAARARSGNQDEGSFTDLYTLDLRMSPVKRSSSCSAAVLEAAALWLISVGRVQG